MGLRRGPRCADFLGDLDQHREIPVHTDSGIIGKALKGWVTRGLLN